MVRLLEEAIADDGDRAGALPLAVPAAGEVVDVLAQPGEAVESGQALLRTANLDHLIARVTIPAAAAVETMPLHARLQGFAPESWTLHGTSVCGAAAVGGTALGQTFLVSIDTGGRPVRPGTPVEAVLELAGPALEGVVVPRSAVIRFGGSAFVYVQTQDEEFTRTPIETYAPDDAGWFVSAGLSAGDRVVVIAAGSLLSEELRAQIEAEEEGEE
jgi:multidrug efflux pump subunit AcrA (membrane-fusion protein)